MPNNHLEKNLWDAADELRANSKLRAADYSIPVLGLIFLKYADHKFAHATKQFQAQVEGPAQRRCRRAPLSPDRYKSAGVIYLPDDARFEHAAVRLAIEDILYDHLPAPYTPELGNQKRDDIYQHIYDNYTGAGQSIYTAA
jgi:type I restriction-modification system DNA methylase subunit